MFPEERQRFINRKLEEEERVKVKEIAEYFGVSEVTIRRDLKEMEDLGLLHRTYGGAIRLKKEETERTFFQKKKENYEEKKIIGRLAAELINDGESIIIDTGTTNLELAKRITAKDITVITNSIDIAYELASKEDIKVIVTGGELRARSRAMVGPIGVRSLNSFIVDKAFIGINSISIDKGITTPNHIEAEMKRKMIGSARKVVLVADSSKFNKSTLNIVGSVDKIDFLVTTNKVDYDILDKYERIGIEIISD